MSQTEGEERPIGNWRDIWRHTAPILPDQAEALVALGESIEEEGCDPLDNQTFILAMNAAFFGHLVPTQADFEESARRTADWLEKFSGKQT